MWASTLQFPSENVVFSIQSVFLSVVWELTLFKCDSFKQFSLQIRHVSTNSDCVFLSEFLVYFPTRRRFFCTVRTIKTWTGLRSWLRLCRLCRPASQVGNRNRFSPSVSGPIHNKHVFCGSRWTCVNSAVESAAVTRSSHLNHGDESHDNGMILTP